MKIEIELWVALLGLLASTATGSFIGCWVFVKVFEWNKISGKIKLNISSEDISRVITSKKI